MGPKGCLLIADEKELRKEVKHCVTSSFLFGALIKNDTSSPTWERSLCYDKGWLPRILEDSSLIWFARSHIYSESQRGSQDLLFQSPDDQNRTSPHTHNLNKVNSLGNKSCFTVKTKAAIYSHLPGGKPVDSNGNCFRVDMQRIGL